MKLGVQCPVPQKNKNKTKKQKTPVGWKCAKFFR
jgi:hypothetical protein